MSKRNNFFSLDFSNIEIKEEKYINKINKLFINNNLLILSWMKNIGKLNLVKEYLVKYSLTNKYFYFNKSNDIENKINSHIDLLKLINNYIQLYKIPKIIILQNISKIKWIKETISYLYKMKYKVILLWNDIQIWWIKEIEILSKINTNKENIINSLSYWSLNLIKQIEDKETKEKILNLIVNDIFLNSIFKDLSVKSIELYIFTITFLSKNNYFYSLRELQKKLNEINKISLKTTIDYIDFSIQSKIIKRCYKYDIKNEKEITSKAKYYFNDNWIRNSLSDFKLNKNILIENLIFNTLNYNNFKIYSGLNWKFNFSFYLKKQSKNIFIHISETNNKDELKKEVNKLNKIKLEWKKFLLVESIENLKIKKLIYDNVEIIEIYDFLEKFKQK